jgi:hypothetical protein
MSESKIADELCNTPNGKDRPDHPIGDTGQRARLSHDLGRRVEILALDELVRSKANARTRCPGLKRSFTRRIIREFQKNPGFSGNDADSHYRLLTREETAMSEAKIADELCNTPNGKDRPDHPIGDTGQRARLSHDLGRRVEILALDELVPSKANARTHSRKQIRQIAESIKRFGFCNPILVDDNNQIIAGHGRVEAAKLLGLMTAPALRLSHLSAIEQRAYLIADNRLAEMAGWDRDMLATELQALIDLNFNVELTGFDISEVELVLDNGNQASAGKSDREVLTESSSDSAVCQQDDQWLLGEHRLLCGDTKDNQSYAAIDAAIRRWQRFTGKSAKLAGIGKTFQAVEKERASTAASKIVSSPSAAAKREAA